MVVRRDRAAPELERRAARRRAALGRLAASTSPSTAAAAMATAAGVVAMEAGAGAAAVTAVRRPSLALARPRGVAPALAARSGARTGVRVGWCWRMALVGEL